MSFQGSPFWYSHLSILLSVVSWTGRGRGVQVAKFELGFEGFGDDEGCLVENAIIEARP